MRNRRGVVICLSGLVIAGSVSAYWWFGKERDQSREGGSIEITGQPVAIVASGDTAGWIVPCGCTSSQSGGLLRRGTFVKSFASNHHAIAVDVGGAPGGTSPYERVKFAAILRGELAMGVVAHNLGGPEARLGADNLRRIARELKVPFVSANLRDAEGQLIAPSKLIIRASGRKIGLTGVLSKTFNTDDVQIDAPREAALREVNSLSANCDWVVVLAYLPEEELRNFAAGLPEADVVIGGPTGQSISPVQIGPTLLASATNKGRFVLALKAPVEEKSPRWTVTVREMTADFTDDEDQLRNLQAFHRELARLDLGVGDSGFADPLPEGLPDDYRVSGSESCQECHTEDLRHWIDSAHHHAWETLSKTAAHVDSYCQQCHTTGFGWPGGFVSARTSPERRSVGCESCHGPSLGHVRDPTKRTPFAAADQCIRCHDRENSPEFEFDAYWRRIVHGKPVANNSLGSDPQATEPQP